MYPSRIYSLRAEGRFGFHNIAQEFQRSVGCGLSSHVVEVFGSEWDSTSGREESAFDNQRIRLLSQTESQIALGDFQHVIFCVILFEHGQANVGEFHRG